MSSEINHPSLHGRVTLNDTPTKHRLYRFCEKKIDQWLRSHSTEGTSDPIDVAFSVSFTEESDTRQVSCETEIQLKGAVYRGCDLGGDTQTSFMQSLKRLQPH